MSTEKSLKEEIPVPEAIVRVLEEAGIDMVFGMPGGKAMQIFDALYDHRSTIRTILVRQESLAGVMAEVYGRLTGKPGVALGQGAFMLSNALLGTLEAHLGCSPMLLMADLSDNSPFSHHAPYQSGTGEQGTWNAQRSFEGVTKRTMVLHEAVQAVQDTQFGIKHAVTGKRGPVALLYHSTALRGRVGPRSVPSIYPTRYYLPECPPSAVTEHVVAVAKILSQAKQPVIIAGNGIRISKAYKELLNIAQLMVVPVATTASGKGVFPENHEMALGVFGTFGLPVANAIIAEADVVLVVGSRLSSTDTANENPKLLDPGRQTLIQIDIEPENASWTFPCEYALIGDAAVVLSQLIEALRSEGLPSQQTVSFRKARLNAARREQGFFDAPEFSSDEVPMLPQRIIAEIRNALSEDAFVACDAGENRLFMTHFFQTNQPGSFISPAAIGGMGYAIPAAMAAKLIFPEKQCLAVCGDGGFAMTMNGLMTACDEGIPIVTVILNNQSLGWVKHAQGERLIASELKDRNYAEIARAMGCRGIRVQNPENLSRELKHAFSAGEPTVLDVVTSDRITYKHVLSQLAVSPESR
ncbi:MAG: thiamine pyrophosphate-binding protein [Deltaproteobacteria bacterium]|nr:thiamine pyrophosphate-binding protein [Deltaproteobacteria bacterium]MBW1961897.1 thiamine pyrophosphate-binding protein [Deltaproteobacteria bacterium]MBW2153624.1 thiamine pyrophosphate-binding protein [Deltaproteobacteria bacterium]